MTPAMPPPIQNFLPLRERATGIPPKKSDAKKQICKVPPVGRKKSGDESKLLLPSEDTQAKLGWFPEENGAEKGVKGVLSSQA